MFEFRKPIDFATVLRKVKLFRFENGKERITEMCSLFLEFIASSFYFDKSMLVLSTPTYLDLLFLLVCEHFHTNKPKLDGGRLVVNTQKQHDKF